MATGGVSANRLSIAAIHNSRTSRTSSQSRTPVTSQRNAIPDYDSATNSPYTEDVFFETLVTSPMSPRISSPVDQRSTPPFRPSASCDSPFPHDGVPPNSRRSDDKIKQLTATDEEQTGGTQQRAAILSDGGGAAVCRICHGSEYSMPFTGKAKSIGEPLISPCLCSGTMGLYHRTCLEKWLAASKESKCEICKFPFEVRRQPKPITERGQ